MKPKVATLILLLSCSLAGQAQLSLDACYRKARNNYPLIKQYELIGKTAAYNLSNAGKGYLPQFVFSAKASYQSEVTRIPVRIEGLDGINGLSKDQYGLTADVNQTVWDGGEIKSKKEEIRTASEADRQNLEVSLYALRERINQLFFGILLLDARIRQNDIYRQDLQRNYDQVQAYLQNGIAHQADLDAVKVELLKAKQTRIQLTHSRRAYIEMLSAFTGEELSSNTVLEKPPLPHSSVFTVKRPELDWYEAQIRNYEAKEKAVEAGLMPKIGLFVTGGYGRPGLDMLNNDFSAYYLGGIRLSWNLSNFYTNKNRKRLIATGIHSIRTQRETFLFNTYLDRTRQECDIASYNEQLKYDDEIIELRNSVKRSSEVKMANGTLSGIDLVRDINAENQAIQDKILHELEMLLAVYTLKYTTNN